MLCIICITVVLVVLIVVLGKYYCQDSKQKHELELEKTKWNRKKEWEEIIVQREQNRNNKKDV